MRLMCWSLRRVMARFEPLSSRLSQLFACRCGSISSGQRSACVAMIAFSVEYLRAPRIQFYGQWSSMALICPQW